MESETLQSETLCKPHSEGGLTLPDFQLYCWEFQLKAVWVWQDTTTSSPSWRQIEEECQTSAPLFPCVCTVCVSHLQYLPHKTVSHYLMLTIWAWEVLKLICLWKSCLSALAVLTTSYWNALQWVMGHYKQSRMLNPSAGQNVVPYNVTGHFEKCTWHIVCIVCITH